MNGPIYGNAAWRALSDKPGQLPGAIIARKMDRKAMLLVRTGFKSVDQIKSAAARHRALQRSLEAA